MSMLLPGYKERLGRAATQVAAEHQTRAGARGSGRVRGPRRRGRHIGAGMALGIVAVSGVAYASQGLWRPSMGDDRRGRAVATDSPLPPALLERYEVLRRPQNAEDRGAGSRDALRWQSRGLIQTNGVRRVGTGSDRSAIVLIPMAKKRAAPADADRTRSLCLWKQDPVEAGGMSCQSIDDVPAQGVMLFTVEEGKLPAVLERRRRKIFRETARKGGGAVRVPGELMPVGTAQVVGLVPDGVARVRVGPPGRQRIAIVNQNLYQLQISERDVRDIAWLGQDGRRMGPPPPSCCG